MLAEYNDKRLDRRDILKMTTMGTAALTAGLIPTSTDAARSQPDGLAKDGERPSTKGIELLFLGTGAADWPRTYPSAEKTFARGQVRGMSSLLINGHVLIDCGPTVLDAMTRYKVDPAGITDILLTHTHKDHFRHETILAIAESRDSKLAPLRFWAHPEALKRLPQSSRVERCLVEVGKPFNVLGFDITGLESNHLVTSSNEQCLYYLLEGATRSVLYATDGSWLLTSTWRHIMGKRLDAVIWDATVGERGGDFRIFEHNDLTMIRHMNQTLKNRKIVRPEASIFLTHMARTLHPSHEELEKRLLPEGLTPAYDGMRVVLS